MKKTRLLCLMIALVFAFSVMLTACGDTTDETDPTKDPTSTPVESVKPGDPTEKPTEKPSGPVDEEIGLPDWLHITECQFYGDSMQNLDWKERWPKVVSQHYGIEITMSNPARNNYMEVIQLAAMSGDLTGIVELFGGPHLMIWKSEDLILPIDDFLAENETWNNEIPELWKETFTIDGQVWGIPSGSDGLPSWFTRAMRGDWLDKFGLSKPYTIDEFYEASYKFTYNDPNDSGKNDTTGFTTSGTWNMQDIFQAFDARLNHIGGALPNWNPNSGRWEDPMIKPEMVECLSFLKKCFEEEVLDPECFAGIGGSGMRERISSGLYGSTFYWDTWVISFEANVKKIDPSYYMVCVGALSHTIDENINQYGIEVGAPRVIMKDTPQAKEVVNFYISQLFGDDWGFWTGRLGPVARIRGEQGYAVTVEGNTVVRFTFINDAGNIATYPGPGFIGGLPARAMYTAYEVEYYVPEPPEGMEDWAKNQSTKDTLSAQRRKEWIDEYVANGMAYLLPENLKEPTCQKYLDSSGDISSAGSDAIAAAVSGNMSIEDAIAQYRTTAKNIGVKEILDIENEKIGQTTEQTY